MFKWPWSEPNLSKDKTEAVLSVILLKYRSGKYNIEQAIKLIREWFNK